MTSFLTLALSAVLGVGGPVTGVSIHSAASQTEVVVSIDGQVDVQDFMLAGPHRLVLDLMGARHAMDQDAYTDVNRGGVRAIRTSQYSDEIVRLVLELDEAVPYSVVSRDGFVQITLENRSGPFESWNAVATASPTPAAAAMPDLTSAGPVSEALLQAQEVRRPITVSFQNTPIRDVLFTFAEFANRSIVPGSDVEGLVSADIRNQPWDLALQTLLEAHGLVAQELETGIIRVDDVDNLFQQETVLPLDTRPFRVNYAEASELVEPIQALLSERGRVSVGQGTNTVVVSDIPRVLDQVGQLIEQLDVRTPQVNIAAKIIFVNRTDLEELGVSYDLKDTNGNQLNLLTPGWNDLNGDGFVQEDEVAQQGTNLVSLTGSSVAALGNATNRVAAPTLSVLTSLVMGRFTLVNFIDALESVQLSDVQAAPSVQVLDNRMARIVVGEETPVRVIDAGALGGGGGGGEGGGGSSPIATVDYKETGVILEVTPHVTAGDNILLELMAERSSADLADSDVGLIFRKQNAESRVLVNDGETVAIGGLTVTERQEVQSGIPVLMHLPGIGRIFRTTRESTIQRDLLILVTPSIVREDFN